MSTMPAAIEIVDDAEAVQTMFPDDLDPHKPLDTALMWFSAVLAQDFDLAVKLTHDPTLWDLNALSDQLAEIGLTNRLHWSPDGTCCSVILAADSVHSMRAFGDVDIQDGYVLILAETTTGTWVVAALVGFGEPSNRAADVVPE